MSEPLVFKQGTAGATHQKNPNAFVPDGWLIDGQYVQPFYAWADDNTVVIIDSNGIAIHGYDSENEQYWESYDENHITFVQAVSMVFAIQEFKSTDFIGEFIQQWGTDL